jgi:hypothetical protein
VINIHFKNTKFIIMKTFNFTFIIAIVSFFFFATSCTQDELVELPTEQTASVEQFDLMTIQPTSDAAQTELQLEESEIESRSLEILYEDDVYVNQNSWFSISIPTSSLQDSYRYNAYVTFENGTEIDLYAMGYNPYTSSNNQFRTIRDGVGQHGAISTYFEKHDFTSNESKAFFYLYGRRGGSVHLTIEKELIYDNGGGNGGNNGGNNGGGNNSNTLINDNFESYNGRLAAAHWGDFMISYNYASVGYGYNFGYNSDQAMKLQSFPNDFEPTAALLKLGGQQHGKYAMSWDMFVERNGSYSFKAPGGIDITLHENGTGTARLGNANPLQFRYSQNRWCSVSMDADLGRGYYELRIDNTRIRYTVGRTDNAFNEVEFMANSEEMVKIDNILVERI